MPYTFIIRFLNFLSLQRAAVRLVRVSLGRMVAPPPPLLAVCSAEFWLLLGPTVLCPRSRCRRRRWCCSLSLVAVIAHAGAPALCRTALLSHAAVTPSTSQAHRPVHGDRGARSAACAGLRLA